MQVYKILKEGESKPMATIRVSHGTFGVVQDDSDGELEHMFGNDFEALKNKLGHSSYFSIEPEHTPVNFRRYKMSSGDTLQISEDKATVAINGEILSAADKSTLMDELNDGNIQIVADDDRPDSQPPK